MPTPPIEALCPHASPGHWPFEIELVLDEDPGITDALVRCRECGRSYLLEMLDRQGEHRVLRVAEVDSAEAQRYVRDLTRGSCDVSRAGAEVAHLRSRAVPSRVLLLVSTAEPRIEAVVPVPDDVRIPGAAWRELACDGSWVDYVRARAP